jgi:hypothetical protein
MPNYSDSILTFKNEHIIYERTVKCTVKSYEMNYSYNPSLLVSGSNELMLPFVTGSTFTPYVTTVGLYNDSNQLLAVAKFAQPIPISSTTDTNFIIKMDI